MAQRYRIKNIITDQRYQMTRPKRLGSIKIGSFSPPLSLNFKMAEWKEDTQLHDSLANYVRQNLKRSEIMDFVQRDYAHYKWSIATLDGRLRFFGISYIDYGVPLQTISNAVQKELEGPGKLLGYRAMNQKLRTEYNVKVPRHIVHNMKYELDLEGLECRNLQKKGKNVKKPFTSEGPLWVISLDGHDKLCGYQNSTFPLGVYGCIDTFSRKILFLFVCYSNSSPIIVGKKYMEYLYRTEVLPRFLRIRYRNRNRQNGHNSCLTNESVWCYG